MKRRPWVPVCVDCGAALERRVGRGRRPTRCDPCKQALDNERAVSWPSRQTGYHLCRCGQPKSPQPALCKPCFEADRRGPDLHCEWCGVAFWRAKNTNHPYSDARRFCSKTCSGARRRAVKDERLIARDIERAVARAQAQIVRHTCQCGSPIERRTAKWCNACYAARIGEGIRNGYARAKDQGVLHICPNCGETFKGYADAVHCGKACAKQMLKCIGRHRYPSIGTVPLPERNTLAGLIALQREVNRRLHTYEDMKMGRNTAKS